MRHDCDMLNRSRSLKAFFGEQVPEKGHAEFYWAQCSQWSYDWVVPFGLSAISK